MHSHSTTQANWKNNDHAAMTSLDINGNDDSDTKILFARFFDPICYNVPPASGWHCVNKFQFFVQTNACIGGRSDANERDKVQNGHK